MDLELVQIEGEQKEEYTWSKMDLEFVNMEEEQIESSIWFSSPSLDMSSLTSS